MKKAIIFIFTCAVISSASAQGIDVGIKAGASFSTLTSTSIGDFSTKTGFVAGVFAGLKFGKVAVQGDLLYSQQGADSKAGGGSDVKLDYINAPIVIKYYLVKRLNIHAGPQFGFLVSDNFPTGALNEFDLSGVIGLGLDLPLGLRVEGRYNFGITDVPSIGSGKNSVFMILAGISFL